MKLALKFNLVFVAVFIVGLVAASAGARALLQRYARVETLENARLLMEEASASRRYTATQLAPVLETAPAWSRTFLPQTVPAYGATEQFNTVRERFPDYAYKEATLNPTNLRDRAADWEVDIVQRFRQYPGETEISGDRDTPSGRSVYLAWPIRIQDPACLTCHSTVAAAPKTMVDRYGPANGFGWQLNEIVGAQIVSVPEALTMRHAEAATVSFTGFLAAILVVLLAALNVMLRVIVVRPITRIARLADEVSLGKIDEADIPGEGADELSGLARSFNRMKKSLVQALKMLES